MCLQELCSSKHGIGSFKAMTALLNEVHNYVQPFSAKSDFRLNCSQVNKTL